ncbi:MAG TPA: PEP-CTERM sorting domain-containing protein [Terriglobia bacterium]|nr:PEP-CTERM sorting domain-containing protein [Terriglobia bacterium]
MKKRLLSVTFAWLLAGAALISSRTAIADAVTNVDLSSHFTNPWTTENNGGAITTGVESGTGNGGTGLTFSDPRGSYDAILPGNSQTISFAGIALNSDAVVNTLMNQFFGTPNGSVGAAVTFTNSNGDTVIIDLTSGQTIRDYNNDGWVNVLSGSDPNVTALQWWGTGDSSKNGNGEDSQRLDAQTFVLPASWSGTNLVSVTISDPASQPGYDVLSAMQVDDMTTSTSAVPEPGSMLMMVTGLVGLGLLVRRKVMC